MEHEKCSAWYYQVSKIINDQKENLYKRDFKFFQVDVLLKLAKKIDHYSSECNECNNYKKEILELSEQIPELLNNSLKGRREFEKNIDKYRNHLKRKHKLMPERYYISLYSLLGTVIGITVGLIAALLINWHIVKFTVLLCFAIGLIVGRIIGNRKEKKQKKQFGNL